MLTAFLTAYVACLFAIATVFGLIRWAANREEE